MAFPSTPNDGDKHAEKGVTYQYSSASGAWLKSTDTIYVDNVKSELNDLILDAYTGKNIINKKSILPDITNTHTLGSLLKVFLNLFTRKVESDDTLDLSAGGTDKNITLTATGIGTIIPASDIVPSTNNTRSIGSITKVFKEVFVRKVTSDDALMIMGAANKTVDLMSSGAGAVNVSSEGSGAVNIGADARSKIVTVGNLTGTTTVNIKSGTGGINLNTTTTGAVTIDSGTTGAVNIGNNTNEKTVTIGNTTGATTVNINAGTGNVNIEGNVDLNNKTLRLNTPNLTDIGDTNGISFYEGNDNYKIGYDSVGGTKGYLRHNVDLVDVGHGHVFSAGDLASGETDLMLIRADGNVGINVSNPSHKLEVKGTATYGIQQIIGDGTNVESSIGFKDTSDVDASTWVVGKNIGVGNTTDRFGIFYNDGEKVVVTTDGKIGAGTAIPVGKLQINRNSLYSDTEYNQHGVIIASGDAFDGNVELYMGADNTNNVGYIQTTGGGSFKPLILQGRGGSIGIGTNSPSTSAILDLSSTTKGFLCPRMTQAQRLALTPVEGLEVFDTTNNSLYCYSNSIWINLTAKKYLILTKSTDQTGVASNTDISFQNQVGSGITFANPYITLPAGTWKIVSTLGVTFSSTTDTTFVIVDNTNTAIGAGISAKVVSVVHATDYALPGYGCVIVTCTSDTQVKLRCTYVGSGTLTARKDSLSVFVEQLA